MYGILLSLLVIESTFAIITAINCGYPGRPAYGYPQQSEDKFPEGAQVTYACNPGYYMVGKVVRRCLPNGTWTGNIPVCDTTLSPVGYTSCSEALTLYPPELAIDNNKKTCFYSNRRKPRWWRMDMGFPQNVISVAITVPFAINDTLTKYQKCAAYRGIFSSQTMVLSCGNMKGIVGSVLHIEDNAEELDHFGLCEVEVFVRKDHYECGEPEVPTNAKTTQTPNHSVKYDCFEGYKLEGSHTRQCQRNGQWTGTQPVCRQINCPKPLPVENGYYRLYGPNQKPVLGSRAIYSCNAGFVLEGINDTQVCTENGWTGYQPKCRPVDCGDPSHIASSDYLGGKFLLLNHSTTFSTVAELICFNKIAKKSGIFIYCRDDGSWSELEQTCKYNKANYYNANTSQSRIDRSFSINLSTILVTACMAVLVILIIFILVLFKKRILKFNWATEPIATTRPGSWALEVLRHTNKQLRKPFRFEPNSSVKSRSDTSSKSVSSKLDNVYEEIANISANPITEETEDKIRRAAMIAAELAVINEQKQSPHNQSVLPINPLSRPSISSPISIYARVDLLQKHKDRLLREQQRVSELRKKSIDQKVEGTEPNYHMLYESISSPDTGSQDPNYEAIRFSSVDLGINQTHLIKDNMIFVGHPGVGLGVGVSGCDNLSQITRSGTKSDLKRVYTISR